MALFETVRLQMRRLTHEDAPAMFDIYGDRVAMVYVGDGKPLLLEHCTHWVDVTNANFKKRGYGMIAADEKSSGRLIGCAGIVHPGQQLEPEIKYAVRRDEWSKGYATEIVSSLVDYGQHAWDLHWMQATVFPGNLPSQNVLTKCGFEHTRDRGNEDGSVTQIWEWTAS